MCRLCCHLIPEATRLDPTCDPIVTCRRRQAGFGALNNYKFGARFVGRVANPTSLLHFTCAKAAKNPQRSIMGGDVPVEEGELDAVLNRRRSNTEASSGRWATTLPDVHSTRAGPD